MRSVDGTSCPKGAGQMGDSAGAEATHRRGDREAMERGDGVYAFSMFVAWGSRPS